MSEPVHEDPPAVVLLDQGEVDGSRDPADADLIPETLSPDESAADGDEPVVPFAYEPADVSITRRRAWYWWLIGPTAASWALSLAAHAGAAVGAFVLVATVGRHVGPDIRFAYGDGRPELGAADRAGRPEAAPGYAGAPTGLGGPPGDPPPALAEIRSEPPPAAPAGAATPPPPEPPRVPAEPDDAVPPPVQTLWLPSQAAAVPKTKPRTFAFPPPEPAVEPPIAPRTGLASAAAHPTTSPATDGTSAAPGATTAATSAVAASAGSAGGAAAANGSASAPGTAGGDRSPDGAGGATTGGGGTAATGRPGIPAGVRDGTGLPAPVYPEASRRKGEQGIVVLEVEVLADGRVGRVDVLDDAGFPRLAQAAVDAVRPHTFRPATTDGVPVGDVITLPFRFTLRRR